MLWLSMIAALLISALSGMGVGGGGLFMLYLTLFTDTPQLSAQGINLLFFLFSAGSSTLIHLQRRQILLGVVAILAAAGIGGSLLGVALAGFLPRVLLRRILGVMLVISGILALKQKKETEEAPESV